MKNILQYLKEKSILCEIYRNLNETEKFYVGFIIDFDNEMLVFESVSTEGKFDGFYCISIDSVITIKYKTIYTSNIEKLMEISNFCHKEIKLKKDNILDSFLNFTISTNNFCDLEVLDSSMSLVGYIESLNDNTLLVNLIDEYGKPDGIGIVRVEDITCASIDTEDLVKLKIFHNDF